MTYALAQWRALARDGYRFDRGVMTLGPRSCPVPRREWRAAQQASQEAATLAQHDAAQPALPGAAHVRALELETPPVAEVPFSLTPPRATPAPTPTQGTFLDETR